MAKKFTAPENIQGLSGEDLAAALEAAFARATEIRPADGETPDAEVVEEATAIRDFIRAAKEENAAREQVAAENAQLFADIDAEATPAEADAEGEDGGEGEGEDRGEGEDGETEAAAEVVAEAEAAAAQAAEPVAASAKRTIQRPMPKSFAARAAKNAPVKPEGSRTDAPTASLVAAAGIPGFRGGEAFKSFSDAAELIQSSLRTLPVATMPEQTFMRNQAMSINLPTGGKFSTENPEFMTNGKRDVTKLINAAAADASSEKAGSLTASARSLVAAGGWGAPSERSLDFCKLESVEGLLKLPEVTFARGGIEWTRGPVIADVIGSTEGFWDMTEAQAEAGSVAKTALRPELPEFESIRLDAVGTMMESGLLLNQGWPELIQRYIELLLVAHEYKMAKKNITQIEAITGAAHNFTKVFGNALDLLHILELVLTGERQRNLMSPTQTFDALVPHWFKNIVRADLAQRNGVDSITVTDAQIDAHFTARGSKVQWLNAYQDLTIDPVTKLATAYPETMRVILYPAGTFVRGVSPQIRLDSIYDSVNLKKNDFVNLFLEQGTTVANTCGDGLHIEVPLYANGERANFTTAGINPLVTAPTP